MKSNSRLRVRGLRTAILQVLLALSMVGAADAQSQSEPTFSKSFAPSTIGPGSTSTLTFTISNAESPDPVSDIAFTDTLPAGVTIATPASATSTCGGTLSAPDGGTTITFSNGVVALDSTCSITVDVTSSTPNVHTNTSGALTSNAGSSGTATADLTVVTTRPGFTKSFAPSSISLGGRSTLTFTIDNTANALFAVALAFTDNFPVGLAVAGPANASTDCSGGNLTAIPGTSAITYSADFVDRNSSCTVTVDVIGSGVGLLGNTTGELTSGGVSSGMASAVIEVTADPLSLVKSFTDDPAPSGGTVTLEFTLTNRDRNFSATNIAFTDDLDAALSNLAATGLPANDVCGAGSALSGTTSLNFTGGSLAPEASCTFSVTLQVPGAAVSGIFTNTTSSVTADVDGNPVTGSPAVELLFVEPAPILTKEFTDDPVGAGGTVTLRFTITNTSTTASATDIQFIDELTTFLPFPVSVTLPTTPCGGGSSISLISLGTEREGLSLANGILAVGASCTFDVALDIPVGVATNTYSNATSVITATVGGETVTGNPATDDLVVFAAPALLKEFTDDPVDPGDTVTLEFTLTHDALAPGDATGITFTDDLDATLSGLTATGLPLADLCGPGNGSLTGDTSVTFAGGSLAPGASCTFSVTLQVPAGAGAGLYTNTTSDVSATVLGVTAKENPATDVLQVARLTLSKSFTDDPVVPGGTVNLQFTIANTSVSSDATGMVFTDNVDDVLSGLASTSGTQPDICGAGSRLTGASLLIFTGGNLLAGESCTFNVTLQVPGGAASDTYINTTSNFLADIDTVSVTLDPATADVIVSSEFLSLTKSFTDDPVDPGDTATLEFTLTNLDGLQSASGISFTDDLDAALFGLAAVGLPANDVCGAGSQISGTDVLTFTGGTLAQGSSCTFSVTLQVPAGVAAGTVAANLTSQVTGTIGGLGVTGGPATNNLQVAMVATLPGFSKSFVPNLISGGISTLTFTIDNTAGGVPATSLDFTDNLPAGVVIATPANATTTCTGGTLTATAGMSVFAYTGGAVAAGSTCTVQVDVTITAMGTHVNTTGDLTSSSGNSGTASDTLTGTATSITNADFLFLGEVPEEILVEGSSLWYKLHLVAGRSYAFSAWAPGQDPSESQVSMALSIHNDDGTLVVSGVSTSGGEPSLDVSGHAGPRATFIPPTTATYVIKLSNNAAAGYRVHLLGIETTLFSPWYFIDVASGYDAFVEMGNNTNQNLAVTLTVYNGTGATVGTKTVNLSAHGNTFVQIGAEFGIAAGFGSVQIAYHGSSGAVSGNITSLSAVFGTGIDATFTLRMNRTTVTRRRR